MPHREDHFCARDRTRIYEQCWLPDAGARAAVVIVHGFTEHGGRYAAIAERLNQHGYAAHAADLRGHGRSEGPACFVRRFDQYLDDLDVFLERVRKREPGKPLFLFGHSMGGLIVALHAITRQPEVRGIVVSSGALRPGKTVFPVMRRLAGLVGRIFPRLRLVHLGSRYLCRDPKARLEFRDDPLVFHGRFPTGTGAEMLRAMRLVSARAESLRLPLLVLHGTGDVACDCQGSSELHRRAGSTDKTLCLYEGFYHATFWEPERERVLADLIAWIERRDGAPPTS